MLEVMRSYPRDPLTVVFYLSPWLDQSVKHNVSVEVDDGDASEPITFLCENPLAVKGQDFCLSVTPSKSELAQFHLLSTLQALIEHVVEEDCLCRVRSLHVQALRHVLLLERCHLVILIPVEWLVASLGVFRR